MKLSASRILLTGATDGIGSALAMQLASLGARLGLVDRNPSALLNLASELPGDEHLTIAGDITNGEDRDSAIAKMTERFGGTDILINNAAVLEFTEFARQSPQAIEHTINTNVLAPMLLTHALLPEMLERDSGHIVNIGSTFGSIAFAYFAGYSASKFAVRGFSEALRRELADSGVGVTYIGPRAVSTPLNSPAVYRMAEKVKMNMDAPDWVAAKLVGAIEQDRKDVYLGFPERLFVRVNALLPRLVDKALRGRSRVMREFADNEPTG